MTPQAVSSVSAHASMLKLMRCCSHHILAQQLLQAMTQCPQPRRPVCRPGNTPKHFSYSAKQKLTPQPALLILTVAALRRTPSLQPAQKGHGLHQHKQCRPDSCPWFTLPNPDVTAWRVQRARGTLNKHYKVFTLMQPSPILLAPQTYQRVINRPRNTSSYRSARSARPDRPEV